MTKSYRALRGAANEAGPVLGVLVLATASLAVGSLGNILLSRNAFSAFHGGSVYLLPGTPWADGFAVHPLLINSMALGVVWYFAQQGRVTINILTLLVTAAILIPAALSGFLFSYPSTYVYDVISFALLVSLATDPKTKVVFRETRVMGVIFGIFAVGILLALARPTVWGHLAFSLDRSLRGGVTLWKMSAFHIIAAVLVVYTWRNRAFRRAILVIWLGTFFLTLSNGYRSYIYYSAAPALIMLLFTRKGSLSARILVGIMIVGAVALLWNSVFFVATGTSRLSGSLAVLDELATGRVFLWDYYWSAFLDRPFTGSGVFLLDRASDYPSGANSEIGLLKTFVEYGVIWGTIQALCITGAVATAAWRLMRGQTKGEWLWPSVIVLALFPDIVQNHSRLLRAENVLFWFSVLYLIRGVVPTGLNLRLLPRLQ